MNRHDKATVFKALKILGWEEDHGCLVKKMPFGDIVFNLSKLDADPLEEITGSLVSWHVDPEAAPPPPEEVQPPGISHPIPNPEKQPEFVFNENLGISHPLYEHNHSPEQQSKKKKEKTNGRVSKKKAKKTK